MHAIEFLKNPAKHALKSIYVLFGDDAFLRRESLREIRRRSLPGEDAEASTSRFAGDSARLSEVLDELFTLPFFARMRLVIVDGADPFVSAHRRELEDYADHTASRGILVLSVKLWPSNTKLAKIVEKVGLAIECKGPHERTLLPWLVHIAESRCQAALDNDAAALLLELVGPDVGLLVAEIEKLAVYVGARSKIHRDDVARIVGAGRIETVWKMTEAATTGRANLALEHLDGLLAAGEHPVGILARMSFPLQKVYHAGRLRRQRLDLGEACAKAGISSYGVEMTRRQHAHLGADRVDRLPALVVQADLDLKGASQLTPRVVLERLLVELASPRRD
jgi:DNA polymerase III subunit delta